MAHSEFTTIKCTVQKLQDTNQSCDVKAIEEFNKLINKYFFQPSWIFYTFLPSLYSKNIQENTVFNNLYVLMAAMKDVNMWTKAISISTKDSWNIIWGLHTRLYKRPSSEVLPSAHWKCSTLYVLLYFI